MSQGCLLYYVKTSVGSVEVYELIKYGPIVKIVERTKYVSVLCSFLKRESGPSTPTPVQVPYKVFSHSSAH